MEPRHSARLQACKLAFSSPILPAEYRRADWFPALTPTGAAHPSRGQTQTTSHDMTSTTTKRAKTIATHLTYNPYDCTSTGYDIAIRDDGTMRLTSRSRWQGSRDGQVYIVTTPPKIVAALTAGDDEPDLETAISDWLSTQYRNDWRMIRKGHVVR